MILFFFPKKMIWPRLPGGRRRRRGPKSLQESPSLSEPPRPSWSSRRLFGKITILFEKKNDRKYNHFFRKNDHFFQIIFFEKNGLAKASWMAAATTLPQVFPGLPKPLGVSEILLKPVVRLRQTERLLEPGKPFGKNDHFFRKRRLSWGLCWSPRSLGGPWEAFRKK